MSADALSSVGLTDPGGNPRELSRNAQVWADLSRYLNELASQVQAVSGSDDRWQGPAAEAFTRSASSLSRRAEQAALVTAELAAAQQEQATAHQAVREIIVELSIQIATLLAFYAAAAAFPALLAWAQAWLTYLVNVGVRALTLFASALQKLVQVMVRARALIQRISSMSAVTSRGRIGYGNALVEGARDFTIETTAHLVSQAVQGKPIDPAKLFVNAAISGGVGAVVGAVEKSGVVKALDPAGDARVGANGRPEFRTFEDQAREVVRGTGPGRAPAPPHVSSTADETFNALLTSHARAHEVGVRGTPAEGASLARTADLAAARHGEALEEHTAALDRARRTREEAAEAEVLLRTRTDEVRHAQEALTTAETALSIYRERGAPRSWINDASRAVHGVKSALDKAVDRAEEARELTRRARSTLAEADGAVRAASEKVMTEGTARDTARSRLAAHEELVAARAAVHNDTTLPERLSAAWHANGWTGTFGEPRTWRETLLYDVPKDAAKGMAGGAGKAAVDVSEGKGSPDSIWKRALLGGATGAARGLANSSARNVAYPSGGVSETTWKAGGKTMDDYVQRKIGEEIFPAE